MVRKNSKFDDDYCEALLVDFLIQMHKGVKTSELKPSFTEEEWKKVCKDIRSVEQSEGVNMKPFKRYKGVIDSCLDCPYLRCGTIKTDRFTLPFSYCGAYGDPLDCEISVKCKIAKAEALIILDAKTIPGWCPLDGAE